MRVVVVASGSLEPADARWLEEADLVVAADGGAASLDRLGRRPDRLVGDLDSVDAELVERLSASGVHVERHPTDKDASDTELALDAARDAGATEIVLLGGLGGVRLDHELANVLLLAGSGVDGVPVRIARGGASLRLARSGERVDLEGAVGDLVTLLPIGADAEGVTTSGLRWPLAGATLHAGRSRGLSNEVVDTPAWVRVERGPLLVVETHLQGGGT